MNGDALGQGSGEFAAVIVNALGLGGRPRAGRRAVVAGRGVFHSWGDLPYAGGRSGKCSGALGLLA